MADASWPRGLPQRARRRIRSISISRLQLLGYSLLVPSFAIITVILIWPSVQNIALSFFDFRLPQRHHMVFVGFDNYIRLLFEDRLFHRAFINTSIFVVGSVTLQFVLGFAIALALATKSHWFRRITGPIFTLPYMISPAVVGLTWRLMWHYNLGLINGALSWVGLEPVRWLSTPELALFAVIITEVWRNTPFMTIILVAGLISLPVEPYESATIDGASAWQRFKWITMPFLIPTITVGLLLQTVFAIRVFGIVFTLTGGGPGNATLPLGILLYRQTFRYFQGGYSAALAIVMLVVGLVVSFGYLSLLKKGGETT